MTAIADTTLANIAAFERGEPGERGGSGARETAIEGAGRLSCTAPARRAHISGHRLERQNARTPLNARGPIPKSEPSQRHTSDTGVLLLP